MKETTNYKLSLYEPNDLASLTDGYNKSMEIIDETLKENIGKDWSSEIQAAQDAADAAQASADAASIAVTAEEARAKQAESTNATAISNETARAKKREDEIEAQIAGGGENVLFSFAITKSFSNLSITGSAQYMYAREIVESSKNVSDFVDSTNSEYYSLSDEDGTITINKDGRYEIYGASRVYGSTETTDTNYNANTLVGMILNLNRADYGNTYFQSNETIYNPYVSGLFHLPFIPLVAVLSPIAFPFKKGDTIKFGFSRRNAASKSYIDTININNYVLNIRFVK